MNQKRFLLPFIALLITLVLIIYFSDMPMPEVVDKRLLGLPYEIETWTGKDFSLDQYVIDELDADISISRNYVDNSNTYLITLYIGYYGTKKGGRTGHNPNSCYPSSGWHIISDTKVKINNNESVNRLLVGKGDFTQIVYHWYQNEDKILKSGIEHNIDRFINRLIFNRDSGAFVRISIFDKTEENEKTLKRFEELIIKQVAENWPIEKDL